MSGSAGYVCAGRTDQAVAAFQQAQKKDPARAARLSYNLAEVYAGQGKSREALERLDEYLQTQPQGVEGYELKIKLQRKLGRDGAVVPDLEIASGHDRQNTALHLLLAREYHGAGRDADAERTYIALTRDLPSPDIYRGLFDLYKAEPRRRPYSRRPRSSRERGAPTRATIPATRRPPRGRGPCFKWRAATASWSRSC